MTSFLQYKRAFFADFGRMSWFVLSSFFYLFFFLFSSAKAATVTVAVAANFAAPMQKIAAQFQQQTGHQVAISTGATGKFFAQINNGAPFDVLLSADQTTPTRLIEQQKAVAGSQFTYAMGQLVLWSKEANLVDDQGAVLTRQNFAHLAIAAPNQAPYGAAAMQVLKALKLDVTLQKKIVQGESIGQTYAFIATGNAELGFVALSQLIDEEAPPKRNNAPSIKSGSAWIVPTTLYAPIKQDAVLLEHGRNNVAAVALLNYLKTPPALQIMARFGYFFK